MKTFPTHNLLTFPEPIYEVARSGENAAHVSTNRSIFRVTGLSGYLCFKGQQLHAETIVTKPRIERILYAG